MAFKDRSHDHRPDRPQIVIGLLTNAARCPVAVEAIEGNTADPSTVASQVEKLRSRFKLKRVVMVRDRGVLTEARIREDLEPNDISWISAARAGAVQQLFLAQPLQLSLLEETNLAENAHLGFPGERLMACRNPSRRAERKRKRQHLLASTEKQLERIAATTRRTQGPLRAREVTLSVWAR